MIDIKKQQQFFVWVDKLQQDKRFAECITDTTLLYKLVPHVDKFVTDYKEHPSTQVVRWKIEGLLSDAEVIDRIVTEIYNSGITGVNLRCIQTHTTTYRDRSKVKVIWGDRDDTMTEYMQVKDIAARGIKPHINYDVGDFTHVVMQISWNGMKDNLVPVFTS